MTPERQSRSSKRKKAPQNALQTTKADAQPLVAMKKKQSPSAKANGQRLQQVIPDAVANRMARRIAIATGLPTVAGMGVFIGSYLLVSRHILDISPSATLLASGGCFLLGLVGLSYGVLSASWEEAPGSFFGSEQIPVNLTRLKASLRALREGPQMPGKGPS